jgi:hypothetical protein
MAITDDIRKTLSDPKPLYALAGAGDLAAEKLKDAPERLRDAPTLIAEASATLTTIANKIAAEAPERIAKATSTVQGVATKGLRPDTQALRGAAQTVALQQVGRLLEAAGKAVETYDELAERGKIVVGRYTGGADSVPGESVDAEQGTVKVVVEQVLEDDEITEAPAETAEEAAQAFVETAEESAQVFEEAAEAEEATEAAKTQSARRAATSKPAAKKAAPRKRASTAPKTPRSPKPQEPKA